MRVLETPSTNHPMPIGARTAASDHISGSGGDSSGETRWTPLIYRAMTLVRASVCTYLDDVGQGLLGHVGGRGLGAPGAGPARPTMAVNGTEAPPPQPYPVQRVA